MRKSANFWNYLFWLGPILTIVGLVAGIVSNDWKGLPGQLLILGLAIIVAWFLIQIRRGKLEKWFSMRSTEAGTNAIITTICVLILLGLINFLGIRYDQRIDFTENQQFTLSPQSQELLKNLKQPIKVWVFDQGQNPQVKDLLNDYQRINSTQFTYEFVDPQEQPRLANEFGVQAFGEIYLESGEQRKLISKSQFQPLSEVTLTNSLDQLLSNRTLIAYFAQGHGELSLEQEQGSLFNAVEALKNKNYEIKSLNLVSGVPEDADVVVIASPKRKFLEEEVATLKTYLEQGGGLLLMIDPNTDPGLNSLFQEWGVEVDTRLVIDPVQRERYITSPVVNEYGDHPITQTFKNGYSIYPVARPVETKPIEGITESPLIWTSPASWAESDLSKQEVQFDQNQDRKGPLSLGVALTRVVAPETQSETPTESPSPSPTGSPDQENTPAPEVSPTPDLQTLTTPQTPKSSNAKRKPESRLIVIGNSQFATNGWFEQHLNGDVFLNSVSWLSQIEESTFAVRPKTPTNRRIMLIGWQSLLLVLTALILLPLVGFGTAIFVWWRRR